MKLILVASIAFAAYLVSSAERSVHHDHALVIARERVVECLQQFRRARVVGADDDPVRLHEVRDRGAFLQEFRVRHHVEVHARAARDQGRPDRRLDLVRGADRHRGLRHDDLVLVHVRADRARDRQHVAQVRRAVLFRRRADGDDLEHAVLDAGLRVGRERQPPLCPCCGGPAPRGPARGSAPRPH